MRRVIRKSIRRKEDGLDLAMDINADVQINVARGRVQERDPQTGDEPTATKDPATPQGNDPEGKDA
jgi:hypothetical protein